MKLPYKEPEFEVICFTITDIVTASGGGDNGIDEDSGKYDGEWT